MFKVRKCQDSLSFTSSIMFLILGLMVCIFSLHKDVICYRDVASVYVVGLDGSIFCTHKCVQEQLGVAKSYTLYVGGRD